MNTQNLDLGTDGSRIVQRILIYNVHGLPTVPNLSCFGISLHMPFKHFIFILNILFLFGNGKPIVASSARVRNGISILKKFICFESASSGNSSVYNGCRGFILIISDAVDQL